MRKSLVIAFAVAFVGVACQKTEQSASKTTRVTTTTVPGDARNARVDAVIQPVPVFVDKSLLSPQVGNDGNVAEEKLTANVGDIVYLTMYLRESPVGLKTQVKWTDANKKELKREEREMKGSKVVTYGLVTSNLKPGKYHVEGYWGGNLAAEKDFEVTKGKK
jgi:hypothetical protein